QNQDLRQTWPLQQNLPSWHQARQKIQFHLVHLEKVGISRTLQGGVREQQFCRTAFDYGSQQIRRGKVVNRLSCENHRGVPLAPRLQRFLHVAAKGGVLNEPPGFVHHTELQPVRVLSVKQPFVHTMEDVEQQRLD